MPTIGEAVYALSTASITDALYDSIRRRIIDGQISPGEKVTEARIASEYNVARNTARASLERLAASGLVVRSAHKTAVVPIFDSADIVDVFVAREAVESCAVGLLAQAQAVPSAARRALLDFTAAVQDGDFSVQVDADMRFHRSLVAGASSPRLSRMHELIMGEVELTMGQYLAHSTVPVADVVKEHEQILEMISAGDPAAAEKALAMHLAHARSRVLHQISAKRA